MKIISLGGVGGCIITQALDQAGFKEPRGPYAWLISSQSFVLDTFLNPNNFFNFDDESQYTINDNKTRHLRHKNRNAVSIHDFETENITVESVKEKYNRRFQRLNAILNDPTEPVLLIRMTDNNYKEIPEWENYYNVEKDNYQKWYDFRTELETKFNKPFFILIITRNKQEYNENLKYQSIYTHICYLSDHDYNTNITNTSQIISNVYNLVERYLFFTFPNIWNSR
jgi:hypothetical protein